MKQMNLYRCNDCQFDFGISEECHDQSFIKCPQCSTTNVFDYEVAVEYRIKKLVDSQDTNNLFRMIENEFGRALSPLELEMINSWHDDFSEELVIAALKEAISVGIRNLRYIDRILYNWKTNGIRTVEEAKNYSQKFRNFQHKKGSYQVKSSNRKKAKDIPAYNWLES